MGICWTNVVQKCKRRCKISLRIKFSSFSSNIFVGIDSLCSLGCSKSTGVSRPKARRMIRWYIIFGDQEKVKQKTILNTICGSVIPHNEWIIRRWLKWMSWMCILLPHGWTWLRTNSRPPAQEKTMLLFFSILFRQPCTAIGFLLGSRAGAGPAGGTRNYASSCINGEGTFRLQRVSINFDRWERVKLSHISPLIHFSRAVLNLPASGR